MIPDFDDVFATLPTEGWLSRPEAELLWQCACATTGPILEVGVYKGRSTCLLAALGRPMYCVDPFGDFDSDDPTGHQVMLTWRANVASRGLKNVELFRQKIEEWKARPVGLAYLDGDHTYWGTRNQVRKAIKCHPQIIGIHDVNDDGEGLHVKWAALRRLNQWTERVERLAVWKLEQRS